MKIMKTPIKAASIITILTLSLVTNSWASPRSQLSYEPAGYMSPANYRAGSKHSSHVRFKNVGPASKI